METVSNDKSNPTDRTHQLHFDRSQLADDRSDKREEFARLSVGLGGVQECIRFALNSWTLGTSPGRQLSRVAFSCRC